MTSDTKIIGTIVTTGLLLGSLLLSAVHSTNTRIDDMRLHFNVRIDDMKEQIVGINKRIDDMKTHFDARFDDMNSRIDDTNERIDKLTTRVEKLETRPPKPPPLAATWQLQPSAGAVCDRGLAVIGPHRQLQPSWGTTAPGALAADRAGAGGLAWRAVTPLVDRKGRGQYSLPSPREARPPKGVALTGPVATLPAQNT